MGTAWDGSGRQEEMMFVLGLDEEVRICCIKLRQRVGERGRDILPKERY